MKYDEEMQSLTDDQLREKTEEFKKRVKDGETLDDILPEAFAVCREGAWRSLGMSTSIVQIIGGIVLHQGRIAEMKTGEGKTLVATLPAYLNALEGKGVHVVTVNDYLAKRDMEWMGKLYSFLGLTVGCVVHGISEAERQRCISGGHHIRYKQRIRLRLPERQYGHIQGSDDAERTQLRHHRRGRLDTYR